MIVSVAVEVSPSSSVSTYVYVSASVSPGESWLTVGLVLSSVYVYVPSGFSATVPNVPVGEPCSAVVFCAGVPSPLVSLVLTLPLTVGLPSVIPTVSVTATGRSSVPVIVIVKVAVEVSPSSSVRR